MTPREALAQLLAVPYWLLTVSSGTVAVDAVVVAPGLHGWAETGLISAAGLTLGGAIAAAQDRLLGAVAGWVWERVEILAAGWREPTGSIADNSLTSGNTPDIERAGQ